MSSSNPPRRRRLLGNERGIALFVVAALLVASMGLVGIAIDLGRGYLVRHALSSAIDAAALAAARVIPQGTTAAQTAAQRIFDANFPPGFMGVTSVGPPSISFAVASDGSNLINITADAVLPTTFVRILNMGGGSFNEINVSSAGQATRRLVDMAFVIDRSGSLDNVFGQVQAASSEFVSLFDDDLDRIALISFSNNVVVHNPIVQPGRGYSVGDLQTSINGMASGGNTATAEGMYQAWNQLRLVPPDNQSGLRVVVLFTDGAPNSFRANFDPTDGPNNGSGISSTCNNNDPDPFSQWVPAIGTLICGDPVVGQQTRTHGLWNTYAAGSNTRTGGTSGNNWSSPLSTDFTLRNECIPKIPPVGVFSPLAGSGGLPGSFPVYDSALAHQLPLINPDGPNFRNHVQNANNAARNLMQIIGEGIRTDDTSVAPVHIYTLGLGNLLNQPTGANFETGATMLRRLANDPSSPTYDASQPEGGYFFAGAPDQLDAAFQAIRDKIIRISQ